MALESVEYNCPSHYYVLNRRNSPDSAEMFDTETVDQISAFVSDFVFKQIGYEWDRTSVSPQELELTMAASFYPRVPWWTYFQDVLGMERKKLYESFSEAFMATGSPWHGPCNILDDHIVVTYLDMDREYVQHLCAWEDVANVTRELSTGRWPHLLKISKRILRRKFDPEVTNTILSMAVFGRVTVNEVREI